MQQNIVSYKYSQTKFVFFVIPEKFLYITSTRIYMYCNTVLQLLVLLNSIVLKYNIVCLGIADYIKEKAGNIWIGLTVNHDTGIESWIDAQGVQVRSLFISLYVFSVYVNSTWT